MRFKNRQLKTSQIWAVAIVAVIVSFLLVCVAVSALAGGIGWLFGQDETSKLIRISSLAPLSTPAPTSLSSTTEKSVAPAQTATIPSNSTPVSLLEDQPSSIEENADTTPPPITIPAEYAAPVTRVVIPRLNLDTPVALSPLENQTWKVDHLNQAVGYLEGTALPGSNSNFVLAAHVSLASGVDGPFFSLNKLAPNDEIIVTSNGQEFSYTVSSLQTVDREAVDVTYPSNTGEITLITCSNWSNAENRYTDRLVVKGYLKN